LHRIKYKTDIINILGKKYNLDSYLELCSETTGLRFKEIDRDKFRQCDRIIYNCSEKFDDGLDIRWRVAGKNIDPILAEICKIGQIYDVVLVDSFHTYECSARDLSFALSVVSDGGFVIMHDAAPPNFAVTAPEFIEGPWAGQSYAALIDFAILHPRLSVYVVDVDWGVAVIKKFREERFPPRDGLAAEWRELSDSPERRFAYFDSHRKDLLDLITVDEFLARERLSTETAASQEFTNVFPPGRPYSGDRRPDFLRDLARVYIAMGDKVEARRLLEMALAERPSGGFIRKLLEGLSVSALSTKTSQSLAALDNVAAPQPASDAKA